LARSSWPPHQLHKAPRLLRCRRDADESYQETNRKYRSQSPGNTLVHPPKRKARSHRSECPQATWRRFARHSRHTCGSRPRPKTHPRCRSRGQALPRRGAQTAPCRRRSKSQPPPRSPPRSGERSRRRPRRLQQARHFDPGPDCSLRSRRSRACLRTGASRSPLAPAAPGAMMWSCIPLLLAGHRTKPTQRKLRGRSQIISAPFTIRLRTPRQLGKRMGQER